MRFSSLVPAVFLAAAVGSADASEREPTVAAAELVEPALLAGPHFRVQPYARLEGLQAHFVIETDWGPLDAPSVALLARRVNEMPLVEALNSQSVLNALNEAGIGSVRDPVKTAARIARDPLGSAARVPGGILRMLTDRVRSYGDRARRIGDRLDRAVFHEGSANPSEKRKSSAGEPPWWDAPVDEVGRLLRSEAGHDRARRDIAKALGIESWTGNPLMRDRLDELAWALASGRMASSRIIGLVSGGASTVISATATAGKLTAEESPENQRRQLETNLSEWTTDDDLSYRLAWRSAFPPAALQQLIDHVDALQVTDGKEALLDTAVLARAEAEALFVLDALQLVRHNGDVIAEGGALIPVGRLIGYLAADGEFMLPLAVDHLSWTSEVKRWFDHIKVTEHAHRTLLVSGNISPLAERALTRRGWSIRRFVRWPQSPPYLRPGQSA